MKLNKDYIISYLQAKKIEPFGVMLAALKFGKFIVKSLLRQLLIEI